MRKPATTTMLRFISQREYILTNTIHYYTTMDQLDLIWLLNFERIFDFMRCRAPVRGLDQNPCYDIHDIILYILIRRSATPLLSILISILP